MKQWILDAGQIKANQQPFGEPLSNIKVTVDEKVGGETICHELYYIQRTNITGGLSETGNLLAQLEWENHPKESIEILTGRPPAQ